MQTIQGVSRLAVVRVGLFVPGAVRGRVMVRVLGRVLGAGAVLACLSLPAVAGEQSGPESPPAARHDLSDPTYLPQPRQFAGSTSYDQVRRGSERTISQTIVYGVGDDLAVWGSVSYSWPYIRNVEEGAGGPVYDSRWQPKAGITMRLLDQGRSPVNVDVSAATPGRFDTAVSWSVQGFTVLGRAGFDYASRGSYLAGLPVTESFWTWFAQVRTQAYLTRSLSVELGGRYTGATDGASGHVVDVDLFLNYHIVDDRLVARLGYHRPASNTLEFYSQEGDSMSLGLVYCLN